MPIIPLGLDKKQECLSIITRVIQEVRAYGIRNRQQVVPDHDASGHKRQFMLILPQVLFHFQVKMILFQHAPWSQVTS